ncbi:Glycerol-3-phosphate dehydrogenase 1-like protein [Durusdinium trenchii]|uniref:Glycerol-3-phosphate dehydrogenase [NAD(+)] n=1 Tax=Durusdinium trenchii TaxID=1381693 RepID=A0ABP0K8V6_9DINO
MWTFEETIEGEKLTDIINARHENVKYLPGIKLPDNIVAQPDLAVAAKDADVLVFCLPHQFLHKLLPTIKEVMSPTAFGISLIKGIDFDDHGVVLVSDVIRDALGIEVSCLMGANVANEVALGEFAEATVGGDPGHAAVFKTLFHTPTFHIATVSDGRAVELCGALKNIVALGCGFIDGLGMGNNTKAAVIRIGLIEMGRFIEMHTGSFPMEVLLQSCGAADLITTCYGGRNRKCAEAFVKTGKSWEQIEEELLNGQKLQGTLTSMELQKVLAAKQVEEQFPLFTNIFKIAFENAEPETVVKGLEKEEAMLDGSATSTQARPE